MKPATVALRTNGTHHSGSKTFEVMGYLAKITTRFDYVSPSDVRACSKCMKYSHYVKPIYIYISACLIPETIQWLSRIVVNETSVMQFGRCFIAP